MAIPALQVLARMLPCFGMSRKQKFRKIMSERSPLLGNNTTTSTLQAIPVHGETVRSSATAAKPDEASQPHIVYIKLSAPKIKTHALTLSPELITLMQTSLLTRRDLHSYEQTAKIQKEIVTKREKEIVKQVRKLNSKLRRAPDTTRHEKLVYSLQCAVQVLEEERQSLIQKRRDIDQDIALRREQFCYEQARIDAILDTALSSAVLLPPSDQQEFQRPTLQALEVPFLEILEDQSPLETIIQQRRKHFEAARDRLEAQKQCFKACWRVWKDGNDRGDDDRVENEFMRDHKEYEIVLKHELEIAEEGYKCLLDADKILKREEVVLSVPRIVITPPRKSQRSVAAVVGSTKLSEDERVDRLRR